MIGLVLGGVESAHGGRVEAGRRDRIAVHRTVEGVPVGIEQGGEHQGVHRGGFIPAGDDVRQAQVALLLDVAPPELRAKDDVRQQVERRLERPLRHREVHLGVVPVGPGAELGAEVGGFRGDGEGVTGAGPFVEHPGGEGGDPGRGPVHPGPGAPDHHVELDQRELVHLHQVDPDPVGKLGGLDPRGDEGGRRRYRGGRGAIEGGRLGAQALRRCGGGDARREEERLIAEG